ncbi:SCO4226 family nickel-binding protein [Streptomyces ovatisporus]|uniref:SCO4226 family nickel-binding protein n=1 Tax=Streptomyces ovatisporus TaxID=1128682 RepID=A0ABV9A5N6_9ACTN
MTKFMDVHHGMKGITAEQLEAVHNADLEQGKAEGVHFEHTWADPETGTVFCLSESPSAAAVRRVHERAGHAADEIHRVRLGL